MSVRRDVVAIVFDADKNCRAFSAGVAIEDHAQDTIFQMLDAFHSIFRIFEQLAKPAMRVDGAALGGGRSSSPRATSSSLRIVRVLVNPRSSWACFPPVAAVLPLVIGEKRARELILTGEIIDSLEAGRLGLCNHGPRYSTGAKIARGIGEIERFRHLAGICETIAGPRSRQVDRRRLDRAGEHLPARADED